MGLRRLEERDLVGKKIVKVDVSSVNMALITFDDGSSVELWTEMGPVQIPELMVEDEEVDAE